MQQKQYSDPLIALLNVELELKAEKENAEVRVTNVKDYQEIVDAEWEILYEKLEACYKSGAKVKQKFCEKNYSCSYKIAKKNSENNGENVKKNFKKTNCQQIGKKLSENW